MTKVVDLPAQILNRRQYEKFWDFQEQPDTFQMLLEPVTAGANADDDVAATLVGIVSRASRLIGGTLCVSANSSGVDANNTSVWAVTAAGTSVLSKTNATLVADTPVSMGTPVATDIAAASAIKLAITNGTAADLNSAVCYVTLTLADQLNYPAAGLKTIATDGGTVTISDGVKGVVAISPGAADNDEIYVCSSVELYKFAANKAFVAEACIQFSEANTDDANVVFGFMSTVAANSIVDSAGGLQATGDYVAIWKIDGGTKWRCGVQANGTPNPTTDVDTETTAGGSSYQTLRVEVEVTSSTEGVAKFWVDGVNIQTTHFAYASATEMAAMLGVKNGSANRETLNIDDLGVAQLR